MLIYLRVLNVGGKVQGCFVATVVHIMQHSEVTCMSMFCPDPSLSFLPLPASSVSDPEENSPSWPSSSLRILRLLLSCFS